MLCLLHQDSCVVLGEPFVTDVISMKAIVALCFMRQSCCHPDGQLGSVLHSTASKLKVGTRGYAFRHPSQVSFTVMTRKKSLCLPQHIWSLLEGTLCSFVLTFLNLLKTKSLKRLISLQPFNWTKSLKRGGSHLLVEFVKNPAIGIVKPAAVC